MGVLGLWSLLDPAGKPIPVESLENQVIAERMLHVTKSLNYAAKQVQISVQVLAVDISIWLNQAVRGMRDKSGHAVPHAHLVFGQAPFKRPIANSLNTFLKRSSWKMERSSETAASLQNRA